MIPTPREQFDGDRVSENEAKSVRSDIYRFEIPCSVCGRSLYVDKETKQKLERESRQDLDNKFTCAECEQDYDRVAFE